MAHGAGSAGDCKGVLDYSKKVIHSVNKQTAVVICNWNKKEDLLLCINSAFYSTYNDFDLIVVDNASSDGSVESIRQLKHPIEIIQLTENIGGAGGFNAGIEYALTRSYEYIVLLDNDVIIDPDAMNSMIVTMESYPNIGLLGAKIMIAGTENKLQEFGSFIDWEKFDINPLYKGEIDTHALPLLLECDYVPACALIARVSAVRKVGLMDYHNFIYWDDIEWGYRMNLAGYKVMVTSQAKVWHKMGASEKGNTFATYYFWRNRLHFFLKNSLQSKASVLEALKRLVFQGIYMSNLKEQYSVGKTLEYAFTDAIQGIRGKAKEGRVLERELVVNQYEELFKGHRTIIIIIKSMDQYTLLERGLQWAKQYDNEVVITGEESLLDKVKNLSNLINQKIIWTSNSKKMLGYRLGLCNSIFNINDQTSDVDCYVDSYHNTMLLKNYSHFTEQYWSDYHIFSDVRFKHNLK
jgi:GT2 family glycosyltransferase